MSDGNSNLVLVVNWSYVPLNFFFLKYRFLFSLSFFFYFYNRHWLFFSFLDHTLNWHRDSELATGFEDKYRFFFLSFFLLLWPLLSSFFSYALNWRSDSELGPGFWVLKIRSFAFWFGFFSYNRSWLFYFLGFTSNWHWPGHWMRGHILKLVTGYWSLKAWG